MCSEQIGDKIDGALSPMMDYWTNHHVLGGEGSIKGVKGHGFAYYCLQWIQIGWIYRFIGRIYRFKDGLNMG